MIRISELALFVAPLGLYVFWLLVVRRGLVSPSRQTLAIVVAALIALGASLVWTMRTERHPEGSRYVPAQLENGRVVPGHGA